VLVICGFPSFIGHVLQKYIYKRKPKSFYIPTHIYTYIGTYVCAEERDNMRGEEEENGNE
jgi:hypothetical protein